MRLTRSHARRHGRVPGPPAASWLPGPSERYAGKERMNKAPYGWTLSASTLSSGSSPLHGGGIRAAFDPLSLVIDHPIRWVPDAPHPHLTLTVRTDQRGPSRTLLVPLPLGSSSDDLHRALDHALHLYQRRLHPQPHLV